MLSFCLKMRRTKLNNMALWLKYNENHVDCAGQISFLNSPLNLYNDYYLFYFLKYIRNTYFIFYFVMPHYAKASRGTPSLQENMFINITKKCLRHVAQSAMRRATPRSSEHSEERSGGDGES